MIQEVEGTHHTILIHYSTWAVVDQIDKVRSRVSAMVVHYHHHYYYRTSRLQVVEDNSSAHLVKVELGDNTFAMIVVVARDSMVVDVVVAAAVVDVVDDVGVDGM